MSDSSYTLGKPPKYKGKGERSFEMWSMKMKVWLNNVRCGVLLDSGFDRTLPATKAIVLKLADAGKTSKVRQKKKILRD